MKNTEIIFGLRNYALQFPFLGDLLTEAADTIESLSAKLQAANMERSAEDCGGGWIPCKDRLPELNQMVLATENKEVILCCYEFFEGYGYGFYGSNGNVIAWMPLPEPYRGGKAIDRTCRNHGSCGWCKRNRMNGNDKRELRIRQEIEEWESDRK